MVSLLLLFVLFATFIAVLLYAFSRLDSDVTLWFAEKFGQPISSLRNKVVWITGASSGIGEALAYVLAKEHVHLVISGTNEPRLRTVKQKCLELNPALSDGDVLIAPFNISHTEKHDSIVEDVMKHFDKVDVLVNNAGKSQRALFEEIDNSVDRELFDINVFGLVNLTRVVLKRWYDTGFQGHIVVTSSITGKLPFPNSATYTGSKHALHGYFECLRVESYWRGITVTMLCPGPVFSDVLKNALTGKANEIVGKGHPKTAKRMPTARCAQLSAVAIANNLWECWIADQPFLASFYLFQYMPSIAKTLTCRLLTTEKINTLREG